VHIIDKNLRVSQLKSFCLNRVEIHQKRIRPTDSDSGIHIINIVTKRIICSLSTLLNLSRE